MLTLRTGFGLWCQMRNLSLINENKILRKQGYSSFRNWKEEEAVSRTPKDSGGKSSVKFSLRKRCCELELCQPSKLLSYLSALPQCTSHTSSRKETKPARTLHSLDPVNITPPQSGTCRGEAEEVLALRVQEPTPVTQPHQLNSCWLILENESMNTALQRENNNFNSCFNSGDDQHFCQGGSGRAQGIS